MCSGLWKRRGDFHHFVDFVGLCPLCQRDHGLVATAELSSEFAASSANGLRRSYSQHAFVSMVSESRCATYWDSLPLSWSYVMVFLSMPVSTLTHHGPSTVRNVMMVDCVDCSSQVCSWWRLSRLAFRLLAWQVRFPLPGVSMMPLVMSPW